MSEFKKIREVNWRRLLSIGGVAGAAAMYAAGCGGGSNETSSATTAEGGQPASTQPNPHKAPAMLTFDALGANSSIIRVFPGVESTSADKAANGTFNDGDSVPAECDTTGREVHSVPPEKPRSSNKWIKIDGTPGTTQYATAVYVHDPQELLKKLPEC